MPSEIFPLYKNRISKRGFDHIWRGEAWINVLPEAIEYSKSQEYKQKIKSFAGKSAVSQEKQIIIEEIKRKKEEGLNRLEVYKEYQNIYSLSGFNKVWYK